LIPGPEDLTFLRSQYGDDPVYITTFPDGLRIAWRPLPWSSFVRISEYESKGFPSIYLEEEIFLSSVLDPWVRTNIDNLKAGTISTIASQVMEKSGPTNIEGTNQYLDQARAQSSSSLSDEITMMICRAFPSYTPHDIRNMSWEDVVHCLVLAEKMLGVKEPLHLLSREEQAEQQQRKKRNVARKLGPGIPPPTVGKIPQPAPPPPPITDPTKYRQGKRSTIGGQDVTETEKQEKTITRDSIINPSEINKQIGSVMGGNVFERDDILIEQEKLKRQLPNIYPELFKNSG